MRTFIMFGSINKFMLARSPNYTFSPRSIYIVHIFHVKTVYFK